MVAAVERNDSVSAFRTNQVERALGSRGRDVNDAVSARVHQFFKATNSLVFSGPSGGSLVDASTAYVGVATHAQRTANRVIQRLVFTGFWFLALAREFNKTGFAVPN